MELVKVLIQFILQQWCLLIIIWPLTTFHLSGILFLRYCSILLFLLLFLFHVNGTERDKYSYPRTFEKACYKGSSFCIILTDI